MIKNLSKCCVLEIKGKDEDFQIDICENFKVDLSY